MFLLIQLRPTVFALFSAKTEVPFLHYLTNFIFLLKPPSEINGDLTQRKFESAVSRALCYSCRLICRETNERGSKGSKTTENHEAPTASSCLVNLPSFVIEGAQQRDNQNILKNKIKDFLLDNTWCLALPTARMKSIHRCVRTATCRKNGAEKNGSCSRKIKIFIPSIHFLFPFLGYDSNMLITKEIY